MNISLSKSFIGSIRHEATDMAGNFLEIGLDALSKEGLIRDIPFVSTVAALFHMGQSISDWNSLRKLAAFIEQINHSICSEAELEKYRASFEREERTRNTELTHLLILIDRYLGVDRPKMLAKLYLAYLRGEISWDDLTSYAEVIDRLLPCDYSLMTEEGIQSVDYKNVNSGYLRLAALGIMIDYGRNTGYSEMGVAIIGGHRKSYALTDFGRKLAQILDILPKEIPDTPSA